MVNVDLANRLWALHAVTMDLVALWNRRAALEADLRPVPRFGAAKVRAHNAAVGAQIASVDTGFHQVRERYRALGGTNLFPSDRLHPDTVRAAAMAVESGRAHTVRGAIEAAIDARHDRLDAAAQRRSEARERAAAHAVARVHQHESAMNAQRVRWAIDDVARKL